MTLTLLTFLVGLVLLAAGGELLVRSSTRLALGLGVSKLFIGLTVVAMGTSAPEAVVSVIAAQSGAPDLAVGNVVGSNIANLLLILGLAALIVPLAVSRQLLRFDLPFLVVVSLLCFALALDGSIGRLEALLLFSLLVGHLAFSYRQAKREALAAVMPAAGGEDAGLPRPSGGRRLLFDGALTLLSLGLLVLGSRWLVDSAATMARWLGLSELVIGLTVVAIGTSLPEIATSVMAAVRGERDLAVGNVIGSNLFNTLGVLGLSAGLVPGGLPVASPVLAFDMPVMLAATLLCLPIFLTDLTVSRREGALLLGYLVLYLSFLLLRASDHRALEGFTWLTLWVLLPMTLLPLLAATANELGFRRRAPERR